MTLLRESQTFFTQDGSKATLVAVPAGAQITVRATGADVYYDNASTVSSSSNDGTISDGTSASFTSPQYLICAQGSSASIYVFAGQAITGDVRIETDITTADDITVTDDLTVTSTTTLTGGVTGGIPRNIGTWQPVAATSGTDTACSNGTAYVGSVFVPMNCTVTGIQYLVGSVGGTDKVIASLHDSAGTLLANSALAGATVGTAAQIQQVALTATYGAVGPAYYFVALTFNGTTAKFRSVPAYTNAGSGVIGNGVTQTFGTAATFVAPTTFTADKVPVASLY